MGVEARSARDAAKKRRGEERAPRTRGSVAAERAVVPPSVFTMGKMQVGQRLKEVVYTLSPYEQDIMKGLFENLPGRAWYNFKKNWLYDAVPFCILPLAGTSWFCQSEVEKEKMHHRY